jgi:recombination protein RecT
MAEAKKETAATPAVRQQGPALAINQNSLVDIVGAKVNQWITQGQIALPSDYSVENAMRFAYLALQDVKDKDGRAALEVCSKDSIVNALLTMAVQGLSVGKIQGYFLVYAGKLAFQRSYFGTMAVTKMVQPKIDDFNFAVVYQGDKFKYGIKLGKKAVTEHEQDIGNVDKTKIVAAYAIALDQAGEMWKTEIMTLEEIHQSWKQSKQNPFDEKGNVKVGTVHQKFTADMCLRTVINKLCKPIINTSTDKALLLDMIKRSEELSDAAAVQEEIDENANKGPVIDVTAEKKPENGNGAKQDTAGNLMEGLAALRASKDFAALNAARKRYLEADGSPEEKKELSKVYQAEAKRLQQNAKQEPEPEKSEGEGPGQPAQEEQKQEAKRGPSF